MQYTIKNVKPTGKESHPTYGTEYYVKFEEDDRVVKASRKQEPQIGDTWDGDIKDDRYGAKFVKAPFVPGGQNTNSAPSAPARTTGYSPKTTYKDNSDGMRQGMCFNNAANFVNLIATPEMSDDAWAEMVFAYAKALYVKGDLNAEPSETTEDVVAPVPENLDDIASLFGAEAPKK